MDNFTEIYSSTSQDSAPSSQAKWQKWLAEALAPSTVQTEAQCKPPAHNSRTGVAVAFHQIIAHARTEWERELRAICTTGVEIDRVSDHWFDALLDRLTNISMRTLVLELHVAGMVGKLDGRDEHTRFASFFAQLGNRDVLERFLYEYPVLAELIVNTCLSWICYGIEVLKHFEADRVELKSVGLLDGNEGSLIALLATNGDTHRGGRAVLMAEFTSGRRLVYKPRPSSLDAHFQQLLHWIAKCDSRFHFRKLGILARDDHGWIEFVEHSPCASKEEGRDFFRRQGEILALLYSLDATDMHFENIIADGAFPVVIDVETIFHPELFTADFKTAGDAASDALYNSVLKVGLLPWRVDGNGQDAGADIGGISAPSEQLTPRPVLTSEASGTDRMHFIRKRVAFGSRCHRAILADGSELDPLAYFSDVEHGFEQMYLFLCEHREVLSENDGPLSWFKDDSLRIILRSTNVYALLLQESLHPDMLQQPSDRKDFVGRIKKALDLHQGQMVEMLTAAVDSEISDLLVGDIPIFNSTFDSQVVRDSQGRDLPGRLPAIAFQRVGDRLRRLGPTDLALQIWIVRGSFATLKGADEHSLNSRKQSLNNVAKLSLDIQSEACGMAAAIGRHLDNIAYRIDNETTWLGIDINGATNQVGVAPLQGDFYSGLPGVIFFLAYLSHTNDDSAAKVLAEAATSRWLKARRQTGKNRDSAIGAFVGAGADIYILTHLAHLWNRSDLTQKAVDILDELQPLISSDRHFDVIGGSAGCIATLLAFHSYNGNQKALELATACGDHLINNAIKHPVGWGWPSSSNSDGLGGFSHGAAGIGWALSKLAMATGLSRFSIAASHAVEYDRAVFNTKTQEVFNWCHGAPGIALARLNMLEKHDEVMRHEIAILLQTTLQSGFGRNHCLCHGDLGNLEPLLQATRLSNKHNWHQEIDRILTGILTDIRNFGWRCGLPLFAETPGLMSGLAGIGYGLLRAARPDTVPAVLLLEPPRCSQYAKLHIRSEPVS